MTRAIILLASVLVVACNNDGDEFVESTATDPSATLDVPPPEVDTALPDLDSDMDTDTMAVDPDTDTDTDSDTTPASTTR